MYPNERYRIFFDLEPREDYPAEWVTDAGHHSFERMQLKNIYVQYSPNGTFVDPSPQPDQSTNTSQTIKRYELTYESALANIIFPRKTYTAGGKVSTLSAVKEYGVQEASFLPAHTFLYEDNLHLTNASNGYGGTVVFDYDPTPSNNIPLEPWYYKAATIKDYTILDEFDGSPQWSARDNSNVYYPQGNLQVNGTAIHSGLMSGSDVRLIRPGGAYKITVKTLGLSNPVDRVSLGAFDGLYDNYADPADCVTVTATEEFYCIVILPAKTTAMQTLIKTTGGAVVFASIQIELLPTFYRVVQKRVSDGQGNTYEYSYTYTGGAVNDRPHSVSVCPASAGPECESLVPAYSEFRGYSQVTETREDGSKTITSFSQDDALKGRPTEVIVRDSAGLDLTMTQYVNQSTSLPIHILGFDYVGFGRYWVYPETTQTTVYTTTGVAAATTQIKYEYSSNYGNLISQADQHKVDGDWVDYRVTKTGYHPNTSAGKYLVGLPGHQNILDGNGQVIGQTLFFYDSHASHTDQPTTGVLTDTRTWMGPSKYSHIRYGYDSWGNRTSVTTYSGYGTTNTNTAPSGPRTAYTCYGGGDPVDGMACTDDHVHAYPLWSKNPLGHLTTWTYDYKRGVPLTETDPNGNTTEAQYDPLGRLTRLIRPGNGDSTSTPTIIIGYPDESSSSFWTQIKQRLDENRYLIVKRYYDGLGRQTYADSGGYTMGAPIVWSSRVSYNYPAVNIVEQSLPYVPGGTAFYTKTTSDVLGRPTLIEPPNANDTSYTYNALLTVFKDAKDKVTKTKTDKWGRVIHVEPQIGPAVGYVYNEKDQLIKAIRAPLADVDACLADPDSATACPANKTVSIEYDQAGRKVKMIDPDMGTWTYDYDALGNLTRQTDAKGQDICLYYDKLNRLTGKHYRTDVNCPGTPALHVTYTYDNGTNGLGQRTSMTDGSGSTSWSYDGRGRMSQESKTINGASAFVTSWLYNSADLPYSMTYPDGEELTYAYDESGRLDSVTSNITDPATVYLANTTYDASGRILGMDYGASILHKTFEYFDWNVPVNGGLLNSATTTKVSGGLTLQSLAYTYDANANVETILDGTNSNQRACFSYDALNRLTKATTYEDSDKECTTPLGQGNYSETYTYDASTGNLASKAGIGYTYDPNHPHAVASLTNTDYSYSYDANGNMTDRNLGASIFRLDYDAENRLVSVTGNGVAFTATPPPPTTATQTNTASVTPTKTNTPAVTPTFTPAFTATPTATAAPSQTATSGGPTATATPSPTASNTPSGSTDTPTSTPTGTSQASGGAAYLSLSGGDTPGGISVDDLDIVYFDGANWSMFFDASDVGITEGGSDQDLNDFQIVDADTVLLTFNNALTIGSISVDPGDIVQFDATSLGDTTAGTFSLYLDGNDVGLDDTVNEIIDALDLLSDGRVIISTMGSFNVPGLTGNDEDLLAFTPTTLGDTTSGAWAMYFDGSLAALGLGNSAEDVDALELAANGDIYLSTGDVFAVTNISGEDEDIFVCTPAYTDNAVTSCTYSSTLFFDGSAFGLSANDVDAINLPLNLALSGALAQSKRSHGHFVSYQLAPPQQSGSTTFTPVADAYVADDFPTTNYGTSTTLRADATPVVNSYLRFDVQGLTGNVTSATLRIYANSASSTGYTLKSVSDNTWTETGITFSTAPAMGTQLGSSGAITAGTWTSVDVTSYITGNSVYNLAFSTTSSTNISFSSREGANPPQLVIVTSDGATYTPTPTTTVGPSPTPTNTSVATPTASKTPTPTATNTATVAPPASPTPPPFQNATFAYDGDGKRVKSTFNGTITTFFVGAYYEVTGSTVTKYYYAGSQRIAMRTGNTLSYLLGDHLGSTSLTTDAAGNKVSELHYKAWGEVRYAWEDTPTKYTFTGQFSDSYINLLWYGSRHYDPALGRFISPDTIVPTSVQGVQAWDRYAYTNNNPTRYTDPTGHFITPIIGAIVGAVALTAVVYMAHPDLSTRDYIAAAGIGLVAGAAIGTGAGALVGIAMVDAALVGAGAGALTAAGAYTLTADEGYSTGEMAANAAIGAGTGAATALTGPAVVGAELAGSTTALVGRAAINAAGAELSQIVHNEYFDEAPNYPPPAELAGATMLGGLGSGAGEVADYMISSTVTAFSGSQAAGRVAGSLAYNLTKNLAVGIKVNQGLNWIDCVDEHRHNCR